MASYSLQSRQTGSALMIIVFIVVLVVIGGAGAYVATGGFKDKTDVSQTKPGQQATHSNFQATTATTAADIKTMLAAAKAGDYDVECTLNYDNSADASNSLLPASGPSTLYVSGATKMRVDTTFKDKPGHFMRLGSAAYLWADGNKEGSQFPVTSSNSSASSSTTKFTEDAEKYDTKCQSVAKLDASLFVLPTGVTFTDINSQFNSSSSSN